ncbi:MAG TPA: HepT-like ribonuclease domain-containing protein [Dehalococcoidia bacterium]
MSNWCSISSAPATPFGRTFPTSSRKYSARIRCCRTPPCDRSRSSARRRRDSPRNFARRTRRFPGGASSPCENALIHGYDRVNMARVWLVAQHDVPELIAHLEPLLPPEP